MTYCSGPKTTAVLKMTTVNAAEDLNYQHSYSTCSRIVIVIVGWINFVTRAPVKVWHLFAEGALAQLDMMKLSCQPTVGGSWVSLQNHVRKKLVLPKWIRTTRSVKTTNQKYWHWGIKLVIYIWIWGNEPQVMQSTTAKLICTCFNDVQHS